MAWNNPNIILYHGTTTQHVASINRAVDWTKGELDEDFGQGFYTTTYLKQAEKWAHLKARNTRWKAAVFQFEIERDVLAPLDTLFFIRAQADAADYWSIIEHCRHNKGTNRGAGLYYDIVVGPVSLNTELRAVRMGYDQISFHTTRGTLLLDEHKDQIV